MKDKLDEVSRRDLVAYRMERARQTIDEAELLAGQGYYNAAINRLYYAVFYATLALFLKFKINAKTHAGVRTMLGLHFIEKNVMPRDCGKTFNSLFNLRHSSDYDDFAYCDKATTDEFIPRAKEYIGTVDELLKKE